VEAWCEAAVVEGTVVDLARWLRAGVAPAQENSRSLMAIRTKRGFRDDNLIQEERKISCVRASVWRENNR